MDKQNKLVKIIGYFHGNGWVDNLSQILSSWFCMVYK